jgi:hypothetical protein
MPYFCFADRFRACVGERRKAPTRVPAIDSHYASFLSWRIALFALNKKLSDEEAERDPLCDAVAVAAVAGELKYLIPDPGDLSKMTDTETSASGIAVDDQGNIYATDVGFNNLRKYARATQPHSGDRDNVADQRYRGRCGSCADGERHVATRIDAFSGRWPRSSVTDARRFSAVAAKIPYLFPLTDW